MFLFFRLRVLGKDFGSGTCIGCSPFSMVKNCGCKSPILERLARWLSFTLNSPIKCKFKESLNSAANFLQALAF